jgi:hypothetical protein
VAHFKGEITGPVNRFIPVSARFIRDSKRDVILKAKLRAAGALSRLPPVTRGWANWIDKVEGKS